LTAGKKENLSRDPDLSSGSVDEPNPDSGNSYVESRLLVVTAVISWVLVIWVLNASRFLRPVADDYCIGVRGAQGPIGGFIQDYQTFSGFATPSFLTNLFVGVPLASGRLWMVSSITFIVAAMTISFLAAMIYRVSGGLSGLRRSLLLQSVVLAPVAIISWWTFLWFPLEGESESPLDKLAIGLTHWQNLNSAYVIPTALILGLSILLFQSLDSRSWWVTSAVAALGIATGLMGPTFGTAAILFLSLIFCWSLLRGIRGKFKYRINIVIATFAVFLGLIVAYLSPGTQARASYYETGEVQFAPNSLVGWIMGVLPENLFLFGQLIFQWGSIAILTLFLGIGFFAKRKNPSIRANQMLNISIGLVIFGVALTTATIITDTFAYGAYWHSSSITVVAFAAVASFGAWAGAELSRVRGVSVINVAVLALLIGLAAAVGSSLDLSTSIVEREQSWAEGPAFIKGIIEDREVPWIRECADQLGEVNSVFSAD